MALVKVPIYPTRNLATEIDPGARSIVAGTNVSFVVNADGSITINSSGGSGTVTSVGATGSTGLTVGGTNPITTSGVLTFTLSANLQSWSGIAPSSKADTSALSNYVDKVTNENVGGFKTFTHGAIRAQGFSGDPTSGVLYMGDAATDAYIFRPGGTQQLNFKYGTGTAVLNATGTILTTANITAAIGATYVDVAGDTMTGTLVSTASTSLDIRRTNNRLLVRDNGSGFFTIDAVNPTNTAFDQMRFTAVGYTFATAGSAVDIVNGGGLRVFSSGQVKAYDANNDTPIELGLGYTSALDRNGYLWNRNNGFVSFGTNNQERVRLHASGLLEPGFGLTVTNSNLIVNVGDITAYRAGGTTGVIFLNSAQTKYLYNNGSNYIMPLQGLSVGGAVSANPPTTNPANWATFGLAATGSFGGGMALVDGGLVGGTWMSTGPNRMLWGLNNGAGGAPLTAYMSLSPTDFTVLPALTIGTGRKISKVTVSNAAPPLLADGELYLRY